MQLEKAIELDPLSFVIRYVSAFQYYHQGYFEDALREIKISGEIQAGHPWTNMISFYAYFQLGQEEDAYRALGAWLSIFSYYDLEEGERIYQESGLQALINWKIESDIALVEEGQPAYYGIAELLCLLGKDEEALYWLEKAYDAKQTTAISYNIPFRNLRNEPGYQAILKQMGLAGGE